VCWSQQRGSYGCWSCRTKFEEARAIHTSALYYSLFCQYLFVALVLIPLGMLLARRKVRQDLSAIHDRRTALRQLAMFLIPTTLLNLAIGAHLTYEGVEYMETESFCGQTCHVMKPQSQLTAIRHIRGCAVWTAMSPQELQAGSRRRQPGRGSSWKLRSIDTRGRFPRQSKATAWFRRARHARNATGRINEAAPGSECSLTSLKMKVIRPPALYS